MDGIGFTDDEIKQLNNSKKSSKQTTTKTSGQRSEKTSRPSTKHLKVIGNLSGASLSRPAKDRAVKQAALEENLKAENKATISPNDQTPNPTTSVTETPATQPAPVVPALLTTQANAYQNEEKRKAPEEEKGVGVVEGSVEAAAEEVTNGCVVEDNSPFKEDALKEPVQQQTAVQLSKIELLQQAQTKLEKENRQKQRVLRETITEKFAKTAEQAKLLKTLQAEVASVEKELSCDISILRDRIDHCNRKYFDARKRFEAAEQEYVAAKLALHNCQELKEGLEEHLFTIIKLNETKKSEKLAELHEKLEKLNFQ